MLKKMRANIWNYFSRYVRLAVFEFFLEIALEESKKTYELQKRYGRKKI